VALDIYPQLLVRTLDFLRCSPSTESINKAILNWDAMELEPAAAAEGLVLAMIRTNEEFRREPQYTQVLSKMPLVTVEKIGESDPVPLKASGNLPLAGIRAFGMGHVIAGGAIGRDMALYGADGASTSGDPAIRRSKPSRGTSRWECVQPYSTTRRRIAQRFQSASPGC